MKKCFLLIIAFVGVLNAYAQDVDSQQSQIADISIDSLSIRLNKLQCDYDFMYCDYEINKLALDLKDLSRSIDIASNGVIIEYHHGRFDRDLYAAFSGGYDASSDLYDAIKKRIEVVKGSILPKIAASGLSNQQIDFIKAEFNLLEKHCAKVEKSLNYYDVMINAYRSIR